MVVLNFVHRFSPPPHGLLHGIHPSLSGPPHRSFSIRPPLHHPLEPFPWSHPFHMAKPSQLISLYNFQNRFHPQISSHPLIPHSISLGNPSYKSKYPHLRCHYFTLVHRS